MSATSESYFESERELPDKELAEQAARLVGFDRRFDRLRGQMRLLSDIEGVREWAAHHHRGGQRLVAALADRYPLIIFHGDVGTGKTATAESAGDALARMLDVEGWLLKLSTRVRGVGHVGEMSSMIADAFSKAIELAGQRRFVGLIIDEGDALASNRTSERAHHEDKVGVNTLIQRIDDARRLKGRLLVILCTNRFAVIDPAILRRASLIEEFRRPNTQERLELLTADLEGTKVTRSFIDKLVVATGPRDGRPGFTFSDIQTRLVPAAVARAFPERPLTGDDLLAAASELQPTPVMCEAED